MDRNYQAIAIQEFRPGEGLFIRTFFADNSFNMNGWSLTQDSINRDLQTGLEKKYYGRTAPIIMTDDFSHPPENVADMITAQEHWRVGDFLRTGVDPESKRAYVDAVITNPTAIEMIQNGELNFVSPSVRARSEINMGHGLVKVLSFVVNHLALVKNPAFGVFKAQIKGRCTGTPEECLKQLSNVQASVKKIDGNCVGKFSCGTMVLQAEFDTLAKPIQEKIENGKVLDRDDLKTLLGNEIELNRETKWFELPYMAYQADTCVSKKIPHIKESHPTWSQDQVIAVAFSECGESKKGDKQGEGYYWQQNFGADLTNLKYEPERGFMAGDKFLDAFASVKDVKVAWGSEDHKMLHAMNLPHTHQYTARSKDKIISKARFVSNYKSSENQSRSGYTEDDTFNYVKHNPVIFSAFQESLKPFQSKKSLMSDACAHCGSTEHTTAEHSKQAEGMEELKKEYAAMKQKLADVEKSRDDEKKERDDLKASLQAMIKAPLVDKIVQAKIKIGSIKEADKSAAITELNKMDIPVLQNMQAEYSVLADKSKQISDAGQQGVRYFSADHSTGSNRNASTDESKQKHDRLKSSILARCHS